MKLVKFKGMQRRRKVFLITASLLVLYWLGGSVNLFSNYKERLSDRFFRIRSKIDGPRVSENIVVIAIDDNSYMGRWPWGRDVFADLVYKLSRYKPSVIGIDLGFVEKSQDPNDFLFAEAIKDAGNVVLASYIDKRGVHITPLDLFRDQAAGYGFTNKPEDNDGVIRQTRLFARNALGADNTEYSFVLDVFRVFKDIPLSDAPFRKERKERGEDIVCGDIVLPCDTNGYFSINYKSGRDGFIVIPVKQVLEESVSGDFIQGKIVLVGVTDEMLYDISVTPFGRMPGILIIANAVDMLVDGEFIVRVPFWADVLVLVFFSIFFGYLFSQKKTYKAVIFVVVSLICFFCVSILLLFRNMVWDFFGVPFIAALMVASNITVNYVELLFDSLKIRRAVAKDVVSGLPTRRFFLFKAQSELEYPEKSGMSLVLFGVDDFGNVLDEIGADKVEFFIKELADTIVKSSRKTRKTDFIARYGETEFVVVLYGTDREGAIKYSERIINSVSARIKWVPFLSLSAGIAYESDIFEKSAVFFSLCAESAMERARRSGSRVCVYDPAIDHVYTPDDKKNQAFSETDLSYAAKELEIKNKELSILVNKLRLMQEEVIKSERMSAVGKVAAVIHHDLSKPIINLKDSLAMIGEDLGSVDIPELKTAKSLLASSITEVERLEKLSHSFKDLYRPAPREMCAVRIDSVLDEILSLSSSQFMKKGVKLERRAGADVPEVLANVSELKQVFLNLVINAMESMRNGGDLFIGTAVSRDGKDFVEVTIKDTGSGIASEHMEKLFKAFFTTKKTESEQGAGLGLYASSEIVARHGGKITVESEIGRGSTFRVLLPCR